MKRLTGKTEALLGAALAMLMVLTACPNAAGGGGRGGTPTPKHAVSFDVSGTGGKFVHTAPTAATRTAFALRHGNNG